MSIDLVMLSNHLILCHLLLLPSVFPNTRVFSNESALCIRLPKYWSFSFNIRLSNDYSGLISFRIEWFDLLGVQRTLKSLPQHHSSKASLLWHLAFFMVQISHPYMTTGKTIAWTRWTFVGKIMSLLFSMLSRLVIASLLRSKCFLMPFLISIITICSDFEPPKIKALFPSFPHLFAMKWWGWMPWSSFFECWVLSQLFHTPLSPSSRGSLVPFHKGDVICISEVTDISPYRIDSSLWFIQPSISHDVLCI